MSLTSRQKWDAEVVQPITRGIGELQEILTKQQKREVGYTEAQEVGRSLIEFYETLAAKVSSEAV